MFTDGYSVFFWYFVITLTFVFSLSLAISLGSFKAKTLKERLLSSQRVTLPALTLTFVATQLGGNAIIASSTAALSTGPEALFYTTGLSLGFFFYALGFGKKMRESGVKTIPELFEKYYSSQTLRVISSLISMASLFIILTSICLGSKIFMQSLGLENPFFLYFLWAMIIAYTSFGGLGAVIKTDIIQVSFILFIFLFITITIHPQPTFVALQALDKNFFTSLNLEQSINWLLMPTLFTLIGQDMGQRCFSAQRPHTVTYASLLAGIILFLCGTIPVGLALGVQQSTLQAESFVDILKALELSSPLLSGAFAAATATALLSTADSLLCALGSCVSFDIIQPLAKTSCQKTLKILSISSMLIFGLLALFFSSKLTDMLSLVITSYSLSVIFLSSPILFALIFGPLPSALTYCSLISSFIVYTVCYIYYVSYTELWALSITWFIFTSYLCAKALENSVKRIKNV